MNIVLPKEPVKATQTSPKRLIIFSQPKSGKSSIAAQLKDTLILDLEGGTDFLDATKINITDLKHLFLVLAEIKKQGNPYKRIVLDTISVLEDMVLPYALSMYKKLPIGSSFTGTNILTLPNGGGYLFLRNAFEDTLKRVEECCEELIMIGHLKDAMINRGGKELSQTALALTGRIRDITCANADAIALFYRDGNKGILNFKSNDSLVCGSRYNHLAGKEILISEKQEDDSIVTYWDKIFI